MSNIQSPGVDESKLNHHYQSLLSNNKKSASVDGSDINDIKHDKPVDGHSTDGPMGGPNMTFTQMLEAMKFIVESLEDPVETPLEDEQIDVQVNTSGKVITGEDEQELLDHLNQIFTPILVMQGFEGDISDRIQEAFSEASVLMERNIISFDDKARMAQLISVCALLIAQKKNSPKFDMYKKAAAVRNQMKLEIQKDNYDEAKALAQKFLVKVSTTNNSSFARDAAQDLLPETQH